jgi:two-component system alkaline phosphatase synthesis response regulator PhoP
MQKEILLVEDDAILSEMYQEKLLNEGYKVLVADNGETALKKAGKMPHLILLDIMMPGLNGFEVLKNLKNDLKTREIPVIVLTNVGSETADNDKNLAMSLGADSYLVKSYHTPDEIVNRIKTVLN